MGKNTAQLKKDNSGQFTRQIGWLKGRSGQAKFRFGRDEDKAVLAHHKLGMLWEIVVEQHKRQVLHGNFPPPEQSRDDRPVWTEETLLIAEAIRKHQHSLPVGLPHENCDATSYATHLDYLRQNYGHLIGIVPADVEAATQGRQRHGEVAEHRARQTQLAARIASIPVPDGVTGTTLYQAIDAYAAHALRATKRESGKVESATALRLKKSISDVDLTDFGYSALERIKQYWAARPEAKMRGGKGSGRPISLHTVDGHLSVARRFAGWLDRSDLFHWELPRHGMDALKVNLQRLASDAEMAGKRHGVSVLQVPQLVTVYQHATDFERLLLLLGLNAAMSHAELTTLRCDEMEGDPLTIKRIRRKSGVYGEFVLWPETVMALDWWRKVRPGQHDLVMVTGEGHAYTRPRIANTWSKLHKRIQRKGDDATWWLSFKYLRKTAAQFVRDASDGEIAGVFLSHGKPVASDDLADVYSNRPFPKVAKALGMVHGKLSPMFRAAPDAFKSKKLGHGA